MTRCACARILRIANKTNCHRTRAGRFINFRFFDSAWGIRRSPTVWRKPMNLTACPLCSSDRFTFYVEKEGYRYDRCEDCAFAFLNPMPEQMELNEIYQGQRSITADYYPHASSRKRKALFRAFRFRRYIRNKRVLDIGCGGGFFVNAARLLGGQASGIDVDAVTVAYARRHYPQCEFNCVSLDTYRPQQRFDFVYSFDVIEHVPNPHRFMELLRAASAPGGYVYINTCDLGSPRLPKNVADWGGVAPPVHTGLFMESNLRALFERYG